VELICNELTYLFPGELIVTRKALKINTVLGSCVSVCLFDPFKRIAAINHYQLPVNVRHDPDLFKYGDTSLEYMINRIESWGANLKNLNVFVYGGSSMFYSASHSFSIGQKNIEFALTFFGQKEMVVKLNETGGNVGRKIVFDTSAGIVTCNYLNGNVLCEKQ
jgi:chemotaxis protein CheD